MKIVLFQARLFLGIIKLVLWLKSIIVLGKESALGEGGGVEESR